MRYGVTLAVLLALAGCTSAPSEDEQYVNRLVDQKVIQPDTPAAARHQLVEQGHAWCRAISRPGLTEQDVQETLARVTAGWSPQRQVRTMRAMGTAVQVFCPKVGKRLAGN